MSETTIDVTVRELLRILHRQETVTAASLAQTLGISEKAVRRRVTLAEEFLLARNLGSIEKRPRIGMRLVATPEQGKELERLLAMTPITVSQTADRVTEVLEQLFLLSQGKAIPTRRLADRLYLSGPTVLKTVRETQKFLNAHNVHVINEHGRGFFLDAHENDYRTAFLDFVQNRLEPAEAHRFLKDYFFGIDLSSIRHVIQNVQKQWNCQFAASSFQNVLILCALACKRSGLDTRLYIPQEDVRLLEQYSENSFAAEILRSISSLTGIRFREEEMSFLTIQIICFGFVTAEDKSPVWQSIEHYDHSLMQFIEELLDYLSDILDRDLREDRQLKESLAYHLRAAIFRLRHGDEQKNTLLPYIKQEYRQLFQYSWFISLLFEKYFHIQITDDELGYVVLLVQAALERTRVACNIAVIADFSRSYASLVCQRIRKYLPEITRISIISQYDLTDPACRNADFILSRIPVREKDARIIRIGNLLEDQYMNELVGRIRNLQKESRLQISSFSPVCHTLFYPDLVQVDLGVQTKEEVLHLLCQEMERQGFVKSGFYDSVMQRENLVSTYIGDGVAIPHGNPDLVNESRVAFALLKEPIPWDSEEKADFVVLLGIKLASRDDIERSQIFYKELIALLDQPEAFQALKDAGSAFDLYKYLIH